MHHNAATSDMLDEFNLAGTVKNTAAGQQNTALNSTIQQIAKISIGPKSRILFRTIHDIHKVLQHPVKIFGPEIGIVRKFGISSATTRFRSIVEDGSLETEKALRSYLLALPSHQTSFVCLALRYDFVLKDTAVPQSLLYKKHSWCPGHASNARSLSNWQGFRQKPFKVTMDTLRRQS